MRIPILAEEWASLSCLGLLYCSTQKSSVPHTLVLFVLGLFYFWWFVLGFFFYNLGNISALLYLLLSAARLWVWEKSALVSPPRNHVAAPTQSPQVCCCLELLPCPAPCLHPGCFGTAPLSPRSAHTGRRWERVRVSNTNTITPESEELAAPWTKPVIANWHSRSSREELSNFCLLKRFHAICITFPLLLGMLGGEGPAITRGPKSQRDASL